LGAQAFIKCENFQRMGAFKFRGGFNALSRLTPAERRAGVVAYSSGNHAQAVALSAQILDIPATIGIRIHQALNTAVALGYGSEMMPSLVKAQAQLNQVTIVKT
jgi:threonine dehydratase